MTCYSKQCDRYILDQKYSDETLWHSRWLYKTLLGRKRAWRIWNVLSRHSTVPNPNLFWAQFIYTYMISTATTARSRDQNRHSTFHDRFFTRLSLPTICLKSPISSTLRVSTLSLPITYAWRDKEQALFYRNATTQGSHYFSYILQLLQEMMRVKIFKIQGKRNRKDPHIFKKHLLLRKLEK